MKRIISSGLGIFGALFFIVASILGGLWIQDYSFISQYISESFATGIPNAEYLRYMYIASGIFLVIFGLMAPSFFPKSKRIRLGFLVFALLYGLGNGIVALFPCDFGCPTDTENSSFAQLVHNASAFLTYLITPFSIIGIGATLRKFPNLRRTSRISIICGSLALVFVLFLFGDPKGQYIGLFQRIVEGSILFWVVYIAFYIGNFIKEVE